MVALLRQRFEEGENTITHRGLHNMKLIVELRGGVKDT